LIQLNDIAVDLLGGEMHQWFYNYIAVFLLMTAISIATAGPDKIFLGQDFTLGLGQTATLDQDKLVIKFENVLEDSRCPVNVVCVWAGNGKVEFNVIDTDGQQKSLILNTEEEPKSVTLSKHIVTLVALNPPRRDGTPLSTKDYFVTIHVQKKSPGL
jgi:hypothetical protein